MLEHTGDGEGFLSWRRLVAENDWQQPVERDVTAKGDVRVHWMSEFQVKNRRKECTCGEVLSDRVKIAVVRKGIEDGDLRRRLLMDAARLSTYGTTADSKHHHGPRHTSPMDVSAVYTGKDKGNGKRSKGKGKNKKKDEEKDLAANPDAEMICFCFHWKRSPHSILQDIRERQG